MSKMHESGRVRQIQVRHVWALTKLPQTITIVLFAMESRRVETDQRVLWNGGGWTTCQCGRRDGRRSTSAELEQDPCESSRAWRSVLDNARLDHGMVRVFVVVGGDCRGEHSSPQNLRGGPGHGTEPCMATRCHTRFRCMSKTFAQVLRAGMFSSTISSNHNKTRYGMSSSTNLRHMSWKIHTDLFLDQNA